jgi:hypothetical protein
MIGFSTKYTLSLGQKQGEPFQRALFVFVGTQCGSIACPTRVNLKIANEAG